MFHASLGAVTGSCLAPITKDWDVMSGSLLPKPKQTSHVPSTAGLVWWHFGAKQQAFKKQMAW